MKFFTLETPLPDAFDADTPDGITSVTLPNDADLDALKPHLATLSTIALQFPKWTDGRAYSQARLLRVRYGYTGEIRATGDVTVDMAPLLARTGFDAVQLRAGQSQAAAQRMLHTFDSVGHHQGDVLQPLPLFARTSTSVVHAGEVA